MTFKSNITKSNITKSKISKSKITFRTAFCGIVALVTAASVLAGCDAGGTSSHQTEAGLDTVASGRNSLPDAGVGLGGELPEAGGLDREIPGIVVLADPVREPELEPAPAPDPQPGPATTTKVAAPTTTAPVDATAEPAPTTAAPPTTAPEPDTPECEGYRVEDLLFESGSAELATEAAASFDALVGLVPAEAQVVVVGHTDSVPAPMGNQKLSELRARAVADAMVEAGLPPSSIIEVSGKAETQPVATNDTSDGRRHNRRVEVLVNCPIDAS